MITVRSKVYDSRKGVVLPLVALMMTVILGFTALVVDAGIVYVDRRDSVAAADAAALAGAKELSYGRSDNIAKASAIDTASQYGLTLTESDIDIKEMSINVPGEGMDTREVIIINLPRTTELFFARFIGNETKETGAQAIATWGFITEVHGGDILPLFAFEDEYNLGDFELHDGKLIVKDYDANANWGYLNIEDNWPERKKLLAGENDSDHSFAINQKEASDSGAKQSLINEIEKRIDDASLLGTSVARRQHMIGLVPIIDEEKFISDNPVAANGKYVTAPKLILTIKYFAYFEIEDIVVDNAGNGYLEALDKPDYISNYMSEEYSLPKGSIVGEFIEGTADIDTVMNKGDQDVDYEGDRPATYVKLIK